MNTRGRYEEFKLRRRNLESLHMGHVTARTLLGCTKNQRLCLSRNENNNHSSHLYTYGTQSKDLNRLTLVDRYTMTIAA
jgi:hypothetical protein